AVPAGTSGAPSTRSRRSSSSVTWGRSSSASSWTSTTTATGAPSSSPTPPSRPGSARPTCRSGRRSGCAWTMSTSPGGRCASPARERPPGCGTMEHVRRGDGRLNHDLLPGEALPQDECGVFGFWAPGEEVSRLTHFAIYALQHRGQDSAGIATSNGEQILVYKDMGLVSQVLDETALNALTGHSALGHCRYSPTGAVTWEDAQPTLGPTASGTVALGHNGNLTNSAELVNLVAERYGAQRRGELARGNTTDTALVTALLAGDADHTLEATALEVLPRLRGAFSLVFMDENTLYAA